MDGRRLLLFPGELHAFRLPSPSLWRDVLQRMRAHGYNAVSVPVPWNHHCPAPGRHDFTGVRDLDLLLRTAAEERLYVVLRPGPYLAGDDVDAGGLPGWLTAVEGRARTADPAYLRHAEAWLTAVDAVAVRHLYTRGDGTVLLYELEDAPDARYRGRLRRKVRADGIDVPLVTGYTERRPSRGAGDERQRRLERLTEGGARPNVSLAYGGTSWGWLAAAGAGVAHGAGAALDVGRQPTDELAVTHQLGHLLRHLPDLARLDRAAGVRASDDRLAVTHLANPDTGAHVYVLRNDTGAAVTSALPGTAVATPVTVPPGDARLLVTGVPLGGDRKLVYSTVQPMAFLSAGRWDIAVFTGPHDETAHVVLDCPSDPQPTRLDREAAWVYERGRLHVTAPLGKGGLTRVRVEGGGSDRTLLLLFADDETSLRLWPCTVPSGTFLVYGPALLRSAAVREGTVVLTGDTVDDLGVEVWGPHGATRVSWNGTVLRNKRGLDGSMTAAQPRAARRPRCCPRSAAGGAARRTPRRRRTSTTGTGRSPTSGRRPGRRRSPATSPCCSPTTTASTTATSGTGGGW